MQHTPRRLPSSPIALPALPALLLLVSLSLLTGAAGGCASSDVQQTPDTGVDNGIEPDGPATPDGGVDQSTADKGSGRDFSGADSLPADTFAPDTIAADLAPATDTTTAPLWQEVKSFGSNPGDLDMFVYAPAGLPPKAPLVVVLHPCQILAKSFGDDAGWNRLADLRKFVVLYPEQRYSNNLTLCFNWFSSSDNQRGSGEVGSIKQMVDKVKTLYGIDEAKIFVSGLSAGGAMTAALLAAYPDVFAGGATFAGVPAGCASSVFGSTSCMLGVDKTASEWAAKAKAVYPGYSGPYPKLSVFHGSSDIVVYPVNRLELVEQWTALNGADAQADTSQTVGDVTRETFNDAQGFARVFSYTISSMPHGIPVDPGTAPNKGGTTGVGYYDVDLWGAWRAAEDWGI